MFTFTFRLMLTFSFTFKFTFVFSNSFTNSVASSHLHLDMPTAIMIEKEKDVKEIEKEPQLLGSVSGQSLATPSMKAGPQMKSVYSEKCMV